MTLQEYIIEQQRILDEFQRSWLAKNSVDSELHPMYMEPGEWDEQIAFFQWYDV